MIQRYLETIRQWLDMQGYEMEDDGENIFYIDEDDEIIYFCAVNDEEVLSEMIDKHRMDVDTREIIE